MASTPIHADLAVRINDEGPVYSIGLYGEFDMDGTDQVEAAIRRAERSSAHTIIVDLSGLDFIGSSGIAVLVRAHQRCEAAGRPLGYLRPPDPVHTVFELTALAERLPFLD
jgi:anti-sigma B factor antagonist